MSWGEWFDLKLMDILFYLYSVGAILALIIIGWFIISIIDLIKNK
jgi:hypothetical protein